MKWGRFARTDLRSAWRIPAVLVLCQIAGSVVGLAFCRHDHLWFEALWFGGAIATLPGIAAGVLWQVRSKSPAREWVRGACFLAVLGVAVTASAFGVLLPRMRSEVRSLAAVRHLQHEQLRVIEVFDHRGMEPITRLTDPDTLSAFAEAVADAVGHSPNHPGYTRSWYVVVDGSMRHEFELHITPKFPESVIGDSVVRTGDSVFYHGAFESKDLRRWVEKYLMDEGVGADVLGAASE